MEIRTLDSITHLANASNAGDALRTYESFLHDVANEGAPHHALINELHIHKQFLPLINAIAGNSAYLARLMLRHRTLFYDFCTRNPEHIFEEIIDTVLASKTSALSLQQIMAQLRIAKEQAALIAALSDISGLWDVVLVTRQLSRFAQSCVQIALSWLLDDAVRKKEFLAHDADNIALKSGIIILGMGKLGAFELNYSSDIDIIVLFDATILPYCGARNAQQFMSKLAQDLVTILQERTADGYVFRTDLRLRPDPMSTPPAVSVSAALQYYETVGQNWERAAMIKARPIAGDIEAGEEFLRELIPYIWRKYLDFAAIADIHSIKRQMNLSSSADITLSGHNIKTGLGGIREIEFFVQTHQLVWGGRAPKLRVLGTLSGLEKLLEMELIGQVLHDELRESYLWFRKTEHALQMRHDEQTHSLPTDEVGFSWLSIFLDYENTDAFNTECMRHLKRVHRAYLDSMEGGVSLTDEGNLVFTGVEADSETLKTLSAMGYKEPRTISDIIQSWHRGHRKSTKSKRSRQVLTEIVPQILRALAETINPDAAFFHFDDFIGKLPSGAQIFSLFAARPQLLSLVADILGSAPALADTMSHDPTLLDAVLEPDFFATLSNKAEMQTQLYARVSHAHDYEHRMAVLRIFNNDRRFQAGVQMLKSQISPRAAGEFLSDLAEAVLQVTLQSLCDDLSMHKAGFAIIALGKLGGREMTFGSDLDIVFMYDDTGADIELRTHIHRLSQRLVTALTLLTREGRLYEVDTRLRPGGADGPLATSIAGFDKHFTVSAWTFELQALTKARVVASNNKEFAERVSHIIARHIQTPRDVEKLRTDIIDMRERIAKEHITRNPWYIKHVRGGMVDCDFIAQYLVLLHANAHPSMVHCEAAQVFKNAHILGLLSETDAKPLIEAKYFLSDLLSVTRLISKDILRDDMINAGLARTLTEALRLPDIETLKAQLLTHQANVLDCFNRILHTPQA